MRSTRYLSPFCFYLSLLLGCLASCGQRDHVFRRDVAAKINYAFIPLGNSLLRPMNEMAKRSSDGHVVLGVSIETKNGAISERQRKRVLSYAQSALQKWNAALVGKEGWQVRSISVTEVQTRPEALLAFVMNWSIRRGYADSTYKPIEIHLDPRDFQLEATVMHEIGHALGLGDTYYEQGYNEFRGQPKSVMNPSPHFWDSLISYWGVLTLHEDDRIGIRMAWDAVRTGQTPKSCEANYHAVGFNRRGGLVCAPGNKPRRSWEPGESRCRLPNGYTYPEVSPNREFDKACKALGGCSAWSESTGLGCICEDGSLNPLSSSGNEYKGKSCPR